MYRIIEGQASMKYILSVIVLSLSLSVISPCCFGQTSLTGVNVSKKVSALLKDFDSLYTIEPVRARALVNQALSLSKMGGLTNEFANCYARLGNLHFNIGQYDSAKFCLSRRKGFMSKITIQEE